MKTSRRLVGSSMLRSGGGCSSRMRFFHTTTMVSTTPESWSKEYPIYDTKKKNPFKGQDILSAKQFNVDSLQYILNVAANLQREVARSGAVDLCKGKLLGNMFLEPSTRTASSFLAGMLRLGGGVIPYNAATSSALKGETFQDTIRVMENYADVIVIRHQDVGAAAFAADYAGIPVINAGDGKGEHPTQALLDLFTVQQERKGKHGASGKWGGLEGLTWTMVGDLKYGRTVHSLSRLLSLVPGTKINYVSTESLKIPDYIRDDTSDRGVKVKEIGELSKVIAETDVLYQTRIQKERFDDVKEYERQKGKYIITPDVMKGGKKDVLLLHPLPRVDEITEPVDNDPRSMYFKQPRYGVMTRMALLASVLGVEGPMAGERL